MNNQILDDSIQALLNQATSNAAANFADSQGDSQPAEKDGLDDDFSKNESPESKIIKVDCLRRLLLQLRKFLKKLLLIFLMILPIIKLRLLEKIILHREFMLFLQNI